MNWMVFLNYESGGREFGYYDDEQKAREKMEEYIAHFKKTDVGVEVGIAEIVETASVNWLD